MPLSESEEENLEELGNEGDDDPDVDVEDEGLDIAPDDATEDRGDDSPLEDSDDSSDESSDSEEMEVSGGGVMDVDHPVPLVGDTLFGGESTSPPPLPPPRLEAPHLPIRIPSVSPAQLRKKTLIGPIGDLVQPGSYIVEAICALPHPVPTHALASSVCMNHLLTGSDDGYIRNYDIFASANSKNFLTAPQRHHSGVVEGLMKSGQVRFWWANKAPSIASPPNSTPGVVEEPSPLAPVYSLALHSDALWTLAGTDAGDVNLFTVRHEPGRLCHTMKAHRGPVSALSLDHEEKGFFSAGWDGEAIQWDLNTGQRVRNFTAHGAQLAAIAVRPISSAYAELPSLTAPREQGTSNKSDNRSSATAADTIATSSTQAMDSDAKSDASFDPLFDDEPEMPIDSVGPSNPQQQPSRTPVGQVLPPKNAPPLLDNAKYVTFSPDLVMSASIDGQVMLWDRRVNTPGTGVGRLWMSEKTPPWCLSACWSADGGQIYAGRRNATIDVWDVRQLGQSGPNNTPRLFKTLRNPLSSRVVSCVVAFPDCRHIACASIDNIRLWNVAEAAELDSVGKTKSGAQFKIIPGHHGGYISQMLIDPGGKFLVSASSNRGWHGDSTKTVFVHDIKRAQ